jgi:Domain of unknown function (DUF4258)
MQEMIGAIQQKIVSDEFELSKHAVDQSIRRRIRVQEIRDAIASGQVIEDYPNDKYGPSCLIRGVTDSGRIIHVQCSYPTRLLIKIVTMYEPDPDRWNDDFTTRRNNDNGK